MNHIINSLKELKVDIDNNILINIKEKVYYISDILWENINTSDLNGEDLSMVCSVHDFLITEVCKIHNSEIDSFNESLFKNHLYLKAVSKNLIDGKRAHSIYYLNNDEYFTYYIGDIHSDTVSIKRILQKTKFFESVSKKEKIRLVFLGDYVDRGSKHLQTIELILLLKYLFPQQIYLLKGNHDGGILEENQMKMIIGRDPNSIDDIFFVLYTYNLSKINSTFSLETVKNYLKFFNSLCHIAFISVNETITMAVHGGIPRPNLSSNEPFDNITCIADLACTEIIDHNKRNIIHNMLWSDPNENEIEDLYLNRGRFQFNEDHFNEFINRMGIDYIVRGHQAESNGYKYFFDKKLLTIFSSGSILDINQNDINGETGYKGTTPCILKQCQSERVVIDISKYL